MDGRSSPEIKYRRVPADDRHAEIEGALLKVVAGEMPRQPPGFFTKARAAAMPGSGEK
jgi:hypothetical protein